jgi:1-deoxy-D-xylulose-5-phosphate synthase
VARSAPDQERVSGTQARLLREDPARGTCILAVGKMVLAAEEAAATLESHGIATTVWDVRSCVPLDPAMMESANRHRAVLTIEDGIREGGIGMTIADQLSVPTRVLGIPTRFIPQAKPDAILAQLGLDAAGIVRTVREMVGS